MENISLFDIIGPVMIGPSSSHTAGACKIGYMAAQVFGEPVSSAEFHMHGSFYKTLKGHGTDRALLAGIMGFLPDDIRIQDAFNIADERGIGYAFSEADLGEVHPNSVEIVMTGKSGRTETVTGSSIGGGSILISKIDDTDVELDGDYATLITSHNDKPGVIAHVSAVLAEHHINIAFMKVFRQVRGETASLIVQMDEAVGADVLEAIKKIDDISDVKFISSIGETV